LTKSSAIPKPAENKSVPAKPKPLNSEKKMEVKPISKPAK
jgi:hypothetical protein